MTKDEEMLLVGLGGVAITLVFVWLLNNNASTSPVTDVTSGVTPPQLTVPTIPSSTYSPGSITIDTSPTSPALAPFIPTSQPANLPNALIAFIAPFSGGGVANPGAALTPASGAGVPNITSSDGGVSPPCGCSTPSDTTYYGSNADQASVLSNQVFSALDAIKNPVGPAANTNVANALAGTSNYIQPPIGGSFGSFIANVLNGVG